MAKTKIRPCGHCQRHEQEGLVFSWRTKEFLRCRFFFAAILAMALILLIRVFISINFDKAPVFGLMKNLNPPKLLLWNAEFPRSKGLNIEQPWQPRIKETTASECAQKLGITFPKPIGWQPKIQTMDSSLVKKPPLPAFFDNKITSFLPKSPHFVNESPPSYKQAKKTWLVLTSNELEDLKIYFEIEKNIAIESKLPIKLVTIWTPQNNLAFCQPLQELPPEYMTLLRRKLEMEPPNLAPTKELKQVNFTLQKSKKAASTKTKNNEG